MASEPDNTDRDSTFPPIADPQVHFTFDSYPQLVRERLLALRHLIYEVARTTAGVGDLHETLKWGQPSYLTPATRSGTTVRIDHVKGTSDTYAIYTSCQTPLVENFRQAYGDAFTYDKNRGITFDVTAQFDEEAVREFVADALTYHQSRRAAR